MLRKIVDFSDIVIALLILTLGIVFNTAIKLSKLETNVNNLGKRFYYLANDFKSLSSDFKEHIHGHNSKLI